MARSGSSRASRFAQRPFSSGTKSQVAPKTNSRARKNATNEGQVRTRPLKASKPARKPTHRAKRIYSDRVLGLPALNTVQPAGVGRARKSKVGKVFVDDAAAMQTILAMVNAESEGRIESKVHRSRQTEELREARQQQQAQYAGDHKRA